MGKWVKKNNVTLRFQDLIRMVVEDYKEQVKEMSDEELEEDRSEWMKKYGIPHHDYIDTNPLHEDIHTITIELEQVRRFGEILYSDGDKSINRTITEN